MRVFKFIQEDNRSRHGDEPPWVVGEMRRVHGPLRLCGHGYHASRGWLDAMQQRCGSTAMIGEVIGNDFLEDLDKICCRKFHVVAIKSAQVALYEFARGCRERSLDYQATVNGTVDQDIRRKLVQNIHDITSAPYFRVYSAGDEAFLASFWAKRHASYLREFDEMSLQGARLDELMGQLFAEAR